jgi:peptidyl-prolyl cis-trans isomerase D
MLQSMRQFAQTWVVKALMLFLMASFSIWGIGDVFRGNPLQKTVAKVGSMTLTVQDLNHKFDETLAQARRSINPEMTAADARHLGLMDKSLDNEVKRLLVEQDIKRLGIAVPPEAVLKMIAEQPQFRNKDGSFNKDMFRMLLEQQGLNERNFVKNEQDSLSREVLLNAVSGSDVVPQTETDALYKARAQKRVLDLVAIDPSKMTGIPMPDDKMLHDYYDKNPALFTAPEYRALTVAVLSTAALAKNVVISDEQLRKEYDDRKDQLATPEQRNIVQVVVQDEKKAHDLAQEARQNGDLTAAAKKDGDNAVPLDKMEEKQLMPDLAKTVFSLPAGQIGAPVKTQLGWHVVQVKKIIPAGTPSFDEAKDKLRADIQNDQAVEAATKSVNQLDDDLAAGRTLDDVADSLKLRLIKIPAVDSSGMTPDGTQPADFPDKQVLLHDAFGQNSSDNSPIEDDKSGTYYVVRTDEVTPSAVKPFDAIRPTVVMAWKAHEQLEKAKTLSEKIAQEMRAGKPVSSFAGMEGITVRSSEPLSQIGDTDPLLPPAILSQAFKIKKGDAITATSDRNQIVARVAQIIDADPAAPDPRKNTLVGEVKRNSPNELLDEYVDHLNDVFTVKIDHALVDRLRQQDN